MMTHTEAAAKFKRCRNKDVGYHLGKATLLQKRGGAFAIKFHDTDVVMIRPDGTYRLNSGGWRSVTTKKRIRCYSPCCLFQTRGMWYVGDILYKDGMLIDSDGKPVNNKWSGPLAHTSTHTMEEADKVKRRVDRLFTKFIKLVAASVPNRDIGQWSSHDKKSAPRPNNKTHLKRLWETVLIETSNWPTHLGPDHLFKWIHFSTAREFYAFRSIQLSALNGEVCSGLLDSLRTFMSQRKIHITEMILAGELSDGSV